MFRYWSKAQVSCRSSRVSHVHDACMILFMDLTVASAFPLLCGYIGDEVMCRNPQLFENCWKSLDVNWGPLSDQTMSGAPVRQKALRSAVMR